MPRGCQPDAAEEMTARRRSLAPRRPALTQVWLLEIQDQKQWRRVSLDSRRIVRARCIEARRLAGYEVVGHARTTRVEDLRQRAVEVDSRLRAELGLRVLRGVNCPRPVHIAFRRQ